MRKKTDYTLSPLDYEAIAMFEKQSGLKGKALLVAFQKHKQQEAQKSPQSPGYSPDVRSNDPEHTKRPDKVTKFPADYPKCGED